VSALGAVALAGVVVVERRADPQPLWPGLASDIVPFEAIAFATRHGLRERLFHNLDVGCYLLWEGWPRYRVFQDARLPAYPDAFHRSLDETPLEPAAFDALLGRFGVDAALLNHAGVNMRAGSFDPAEWALVYVGAAWRRHDAFVFARRTDRHRDVIARFEIPWRPRFRFADGTWLEPQWQRPARTPLAACEWDRRLARALDAEARPDEALAAEGRAVAAGCLGPADEARVRFRLGAAWQRQGDFTAARREYDRVLALRPDHADALVNRGFALVPVDPAAARRDFEAALRLGPERADARQGLTLLGGPPPSQPTAR
jgi:tetratricopeptide (TPR) repeat protein